ncbi:hypothetical protein SAMN05216431_10887 [Ligilactobacillus sp. WC1T17]|uniref:Uncharacterized protein n=1 Tax=Ligilactobacillus ruminis TaxID=1623 RepID=A0ABY1ACB2_9LACO|nr:hypothetical protein SAMN05216431_10887 [Ligilactobacillus ruminis]
MALKFANKTKLALYVFLSLFCACGVTLSLHM